MKPGVRLAIGDAVLELTRPAYPCEKIAGSFLEGEFGRVSEKVHPGWSRFYSRVLSEGVVRVGDGVQPGVILGVLGILLHENDVHVRLGIESFWLVSKPMLVPRGKDGGPRAEKSHETATPRRGGCRVSCTWTTSGHL